MNDNMTFRILDIIRGTTVDGPGFRTSIYFAGCPHHCKGCQNPQSWDSEGGKIMSLKEIMKIVDEEEFNVTLTGGDPLLNPEKLAVLAQAIKAAGYNIWLYTGYTFEEIQQDERLKLPLAYIDVIVDGPYIEAFRNPDLKFRGSSNQRIILLNH